MGHGKGWGQTSSQVLPSESQGAGSKAAVRMGSGRAEFQGEVPVGPSCRPVSGPCGFLGLFLVGHPQSSRDISHLLPSVTVCLSNHPSTLPHLTPSLPSSNTHAHCTGTCCVSDPMGLQMGTWTCLGRHLPSGSPGGIDEC